MPPTHSTLHLFVFIILLSIVLAQKGFSINGVALYDYSGYSISVGDVNGDNTDDILIGAPGEDFNGSKDSGSSYVIFGNKNTISISSPFNLNSLNGQNGFTINGIAEGDFLGYSVSLRGDINGDNINDILIGACDADSKGGIDSGQSFVIFGRKSTEYTYPLRFDLKTLNGKNGFVINGISEHDYSGRSVSTGGDINGDKIHDILISAPFGNPNGVKDAGQTYLIFGSKSEFTSEFDLSSLDGKNGFAINGISEIDNSGWVVSLGGDVNGDGLGDILIGAFLADANGKSDCGQSYLIFGKISTNFPREFNLSNLNGENGFVINGIDSNDHAGTSVCIGGDVNNDNIDDILIGADKADVNGNKDSGQSYIIFGKNSTFNSEFNLSNLNGENGFYINGIGKGDISGFSVSVGGDINGDKIDDILIGGFRADYNDNIDVGQTYVIFGKNNSFLFPSFINLNNLNGINGFTIHGIFAYDLLGYSVNLKGDVNGDGIDDIIIGAINVTINGFVAVGQTYVIYGQNTFKTPFPVNVYLKDLRNTIVIKEIVINDVFVDSLLPFSFYISESVFTNWIGKPIVYSVTVNSLPLPSWLKFSSKNNLLFEGVYNNFGSFPVSVVGTNHNGKVTVNFFLNFKQAFVSSLPESSPVAVSQVISSSSPPSYVPIQIEVQTTPLESNSAEDYQHLEILFMVVVAVIIVVITSHFIRKRKSPQNWVPRRGPAL